MPFLFPILALFGLGVVASAGTKRRRPAPTPVLEVEKMGVNQNLWRFHTVDAYVDFLEHEDELEAQGFAVGPVAIIYSHPGQPELAAAHEVLLGLAEQNPEGIFYEVSKGILIDGLIEAGAEVEDESIPGSIVIVPGPHWDEALEIGPDAPDAAVTALVNDIFAKYLALLESGPDIGDDALPPSPEALACFQACNDFYVPGTSEHDVCLMQCAD